MDSQWIKMNKTCPVCNKDNSPFAQTCVSCGAPLSYKFPGSMETSISDKHPPDLSSQSSTHSDENQFTHSDSIYKDTQTNVIGGETPRGYDAPPVVRFLFVIIDTIYPGLNPKTRNIALGILSIFICTAFIFYFSRMAFDEQYKNCFIGSKKAGMRVHKTLEKFHSKYNHYPTTEESKENIVKFLNEFMDEECIRTNNEKCSDAQHISLNFDCGTMSIKYSVLNDGSYYASLIASNIEGASRICVTTEGVMPDKYIKGGKASTCLLNSKLSKQK